MRYEKRIKRQKNDKKNIAKDIRFKALETFGETKKEKAKQLLTASPNKVRIAKLEKLLIERNKNLKHWSTSGLSTTVNWNLKSKTLKYENKNLRFIDHKMKV